MEKITFGYWNIRGLAEPIRYLLYYQRADFIDKRYTFGEEEWAKDKFNLNLDFPNLPYILDGDVRLTQSTTILRYFGQKYNLDGRTASEKLRVSLVEQQIIDLRVNFALTAYSPEFEAKKPELLKRAPESLKAFEIFLGGNDFICGDAVAYVDFMLAENFDLHSYLMPEVVRDFPALAAHRDRVFGLPGVREYRKSSVYRRWPINGPMATYGARGEEPKRE